MKKRLIILTIFVFAVQTSYGQKEKTPNDISEAIAMLNTDCPDSLKSIITRTVNDSLMFLCYPWGGDYKTIFDWTETDNIESNIKKYLENKGISSNQHQQTVILIAYKTTLLGKQYDENLILQPFQIIEAKWAKEDSIRFTADSLSGVYIPKDIEDCFKQIDSFWSDSTKNMVRKWSEREFSAEAHMGFGLWMRNNWQLWGGSRLSKYFNELGIFHPDDMSGIILVSYHRYLKNEEIKLEEQVQFYKAYWKRSNNK